MNQTSELREAKIEPRKVSELKNWDNNPRSIKQSDFERLKKQILKLGVYKPLLVNQDNVVLGGNMRLRALKELGVNEIMCSVVITETENQMVEYALSDNDRAGEYDQQGLAELVVKIPIDLDLYHVDIGRSWKIRDVLSQFTGEDDAPEPEVDPEKVISKVGEVYQLGEHRLMCGSAEKMEDVDKLMGGGQSSHCLY